jgi:hypothetical protein
MRSSGFLEDAPSLLPLSQVFLLSRFIRPVRVVPPITNTAEDSGGNAGVQASIQEDVDLERVPVWI